MTNEEFVALIESLDVADEMQIDAFAMSRGILKALRIILRCSEGESILRRAITVMRRANRLAEKYPEFGPI